MYKYNIKTGRMLMNFNERAAVFKKYRKPDSRFTDKIIELLNINKGSVIADIGAGSGKYTIELMNKGYNVHAVEPCLEMIQQCINGVDINWIVSFAEEINLPDEAVDAAIIIMAIHHFSDLKRSLKEIYRIVKTGGRVLIFTVDPIVAKGAWFIDYWSNIATYIEKYHMDISDLKNIVSDVFNNKADDYAYEFPHDFQDAFIYAYWKKPYELLRKEAQNAMTSFNYVGKHHANEGSMKLYNDLEAGAWNAKYSGLLDKSFCDCGCKFIHVIKR